MNGVYSSLRDIYLRRGIGKLLNLNNITVDDDRKNDYKYKELGKTLWEQILPLFELLDSLTKCREDMTVLLSNVRELYNKKEFPVRKTASGEV